MSQTDLIFFDVSVVTVTGIVPLKRGIVPLKR
jgi:hypothetical protein